MNAPFLVGGRNIVCTGSIGIALTSLAAALPEDLLRDADLAMYRAKRRGRCRVEVFDSQVRAQADELHETEEALRRALCAGELRVVYQPITDLATNRVVGVETLVRWQHPTRGLLLPAEFLEVAEDNGLIVPIGRWILSQALQQTACWHARRARSSPSPSTSRCGS
jgi:predicted signal transduction protein with EAL and GGDEF domain